VFTVIFTQAARAELIDAQDWLWTRSRRTAGRGPLQWKKRIWAFLGGAKGQRDTSLPAMVISVSKPLGGSGPSRRNLPKLHNRKSFWWSAHSLGEHPNLWFVPEGWWL